MKERKRDRTAAFLGIAAIILLIGGAVLLIAQIIRTQQSQAESIEQDQPVIGSTSPETVLFLSSYNPSFEIFDDEIASIEEVLYENGIACDCISMDSKVFGSKQDLAAFQKMMQERFRDGCSYAGIIAADDNALQFCVDNREEMFEDIPIIYFGADDVELAREASSQPYFDGYLEDDCISETLEIAQRIMPAATKVLGIYDETLAGYGRQKSLEQLESSYPDLTFDTWDFTAHSLEATSEEMASLGEDTIVIVLSAYWDGNSRYYSSDQAAAILSGAADIPIFHDAPYGFASGYTAGAYMDFSKVAGMAAQRMVDVLSGKLRPQDVNEPLDTGDAVTRVVSYPMMEKFGLGLQNLPVGTEVLDRPETFWSTYRTVLVPALTILAGFLFLLLYFHRMYSMSRSREQALQQSMKELSISREKMRWTSEHDYLTGLYNRQTAIRKFSDYGASGNPVYAVLLIDVDNFKSINEVYGHENGDRILQELSRKLSAFGETHDAQICRYGGDEFLILLKNRHLGDVTSPILQEIGAIFREPVRIGQDSVVPSGSCGAADSSENSTMEETILDADIALNAAKKQSKNLAVFYSGDMKREVGVVAKTKAAIIDAVENDGFFMVYQPKVDAVTGEITGYEALVRMRRGNISPGVFIPIAESTGWIRMIGRITMQKSVEQLAQWKRAGVSLRPVSVNFSAAQVGDRQFIPFLKNLLQQYEIDPRYVEIEITERLFIGDSRRAQELLDAFREMGIHLLMDDFGTGYSSLSYLTYIPVDVIKIDKSLVDSYLVEGHDDFLRDVVRLAHDLGKKVTVEGVETREQFTRLREFGCDSIQGYYFAKPLPAEEIPGFSIPKEKL